ncbi:glutaminyl-peptide cyclotransferase [Streptomyces marianii]|uniref:Glutaminyl-peptide cyclotransferase n=2 Tax=Streptomyces marianii TaxID=1817406 RepID=A0A5R9DSI6_9ACTN|nr:glutaminyl-peptide cyclotransferase [Streptomyces marianii]
MDPRCRPLALDGGAVRWIPFLRRDRVGVTARTTTNAMVPGAVEGPRVSRWMVPTLGVEVIERYPHPGQGFTQGLVVEGDLVWESTGLYGQSTLRCYRLGDAVLQWVGALGDELFGEGICRIGCSLWQLTWKEHLALRWCPRTRTLQQTVALDRHGWGACRMGGVLVTTDGTDELVVRNAHALCPVRTLRATAAACGSDPIGRLNDLTYARGRLWTNLFRTPSNAQDLWIGPGRVPRGTRRAYLPE